MRICERTAPFADKIVAAKALPALIRIGGFLMIDFIKKTEHRALQNTDKYSP
jgi:hypothetical protein